MKTWQLQEARRQFSHVFNEAREHGPQRVTRHGKSAVVIVSEAEWERLVKKAPSLGALLLANPLEKGDLPKRRPARVLRETGYE